MGKYVLARDHLTGRYVSVPEEHLDPDVLVSTREVAHHLGVSPLRARQLIASRRIPGVQLAAGGTWRVRRSTLERVKEEGLR